MFRGLTAREILLRNAEGGAGGGGMPSAGQAGEGAGTQQPGDGQGAQGAPHGGAGSGGGMSLEQLQAELEKARKALKESNDFNAGKRKRLEELETAEEERQRGKLTDVERLQKDAQTAQTKLQAAEQRLAEMEKAHKEAVIQYEVKLQASAMGIIDPDAAVKLLDWNTLEFDDQGAPKNVEAALKKLVGAKPYLVKAQGGSAGLGTPAGKPKTPAPAEGSKDEFEALVRRQIIR